MLPFAVSMASKMFAVIKRYRIDLINAHWALPSGLVAVLTKKMHGLPVLTTLYGVEVFALKGPYGGLKPILAWTINNSDKAVAVSDATRDLADEISGREAVAILPDPIDTEFFSPLSRGDEISEKHQLRNWKVIFSCGRMVERKGFRYLVEAMPGVIAQFGKTKLIIAGEGPERPGLERLAHDLGIGRHVIFPGFVPNEDIQKYYAACDIFVLPAIIDRYGDTEGSGTILLEAMATGKPVIGSNVGGIPYALRHGGGFLVREKDPQQIAEMIRVLLGNGELRHRIGNEGRKIVEEEFSCPRIARRYLEEFEMLVRAKRQSDVALQTHDADPKEV